MQSKAATVEAYLAELPDDRREAIKAVRAVILANLDESYEEGMQYGMISYFVPHRIYPAGYHCDPSQPLPFTCLASQKNHLSLYMLGIYADDHAHLKWFKTAWAKTGKKLDMGKSCIRFKTLADLPLEVIGEAIRRLPVKKFIADYEAAIGAERKRPTAKKKAVQKSARPVKKSAPKKSAKAARKK